MLMRRPRAMLAASGGASLRKPSFEEHLLLDPVFDDRAGDLALDAGPHQLLVTLILGARHDEEDVRLLELALDLDVRQRHVGLAARPFARRLPGRLLVGLRGPLLCWARRSGFALGFRGRLRRSLFGRRREPFRLALLRTRRLRRSGER